MKKQDQINQEEKKYQLNQFWVRLLELIPVFLVIIVAILVLNHPSVKEKIAEFEEKEEWADSVKGDYLQMVADDTDDGFTYYRDLRTDVMYCLNAAGLGNGLTAMIDADGTALLYSEWLEQEAETNVD